MYYINHCVHVCVKSTEMHPRVGEIHLFDFKRDGGEVGSHFKFPISKPITEFDIVSGPVRRRDAADLGSVNKSGPERVSWTSGNVGAQQCDVFTRPDLHSLRLRT